jgi:hypothetical protein
MLRTDIRCGRRSAAAEEICGFCTSIPIIRRRVLQEPVRPAGGLGDEVDVYTPVPKGFQAAGRDFGPYALVEANHLRLDRFFFPLKQRKMLRGVLRHYAPERYDVLHAHSLLTTARGMSLSRRFGVPYLVAVRDTDVNVMLRACLPCARWRGRSSKARPG